MRLYRKLRALMAKEWGISLFEFDAKQARGEILLLDVFDHLNALIATEPFKGQAVVEYLYHEKLQAEKQEAENKAKRIAELKNFYKLLCGAYCETEQAKERLEINKKAALDEIKRLQG